MSRLIRICLENAPDSTYSSASRIAAGRAVCHLHILQPYLHSTNEPRCLRYVAAWTNSYVTGYRFWKSMYENKSLNRQYKNIDVTEYGFGKWRQINIKSNQMIYQIIMFTNIEKHGCARDSLRERWRVNRDTWRNNKSSDLSNKANTDMRERYPRGQSYPRSWDVWSS